MEADTLLSIYFIAITIRKNQNDPKPSYCTFRLAEKELTYKGPPESVARDTRNLKSACNTLITSKAVGYTANIEVGSINGYQHRGRKYYTNGGQGHMRRAKKL